MIALSESVSELKEQTKEPLDRIIWSHKEDVGPLVIILAAIHGNETAGYHACKRVAEQLSVSKDNLEGSVYMITGNVQALHKGVRYVDQDLNRLWGNVSEGLENDEQKHSVEWREAEELLDLLDSIIKDHKYINKDITFIDLHTTSVNSCAFILFNDTLKNRKIATYFPVPQILGIEETIHGTLLSYINDMEYPAIGFEAGRHEDMSSINRTEAFLKLYLHHVNIDPLDLHRVHFYEGKMKDKSVIDDKYYEITYHHYVEDASKFKMKEGYLNFDRVQKGDLLAYYEQEPIYAPKEGLIFMPLYQAKGNDGFFILKGRSPFWLELSSIFRDSFINDYLHLLPGVEQEGDESYTVNLEITRFFVKEIFHLLGYRVIKKDPRTLICYKR